MKKMHLSIIVLFVITMGCAKDDDSVDLFGEYSCPSYEATNIEPRLGDWQFVEKEGNENLYYEGFVVYKPKNENILVVGEYWGAYSQKRDDYPTCGSPEIIDGAFRLQWGCVFRFCHHCPTDGFCFSGHFISPTKAEGSLEFYPCESSKIYYWEAEWMQE